MKYTSALTYLSLVFFASISSPIHAQTSDDKTVIAISMSISHTPQFSGKWGTWGNAKHKPTTIDSSGRHDIPSTYYPLIGLYDNADPDYVEYHLQLSKMCGIDTISLYIKATLDKTDLATLKNYISGMERYKIKGLARLQKNTPVDQIQNLYELFLPVCFQIQGHPTMGYFVINPPDLPALDKWKSSFSQDSQPYIVRLLADTRTLKEEEKRVVDGVYGWVGSSPKNPYHTDHPPYDRYYTLDDVKNGRKLDLELLHHIKSSGQVKWVADGISPGFDNSLKIPSAMEKGPWPYQIERADGETYSFRWQSAIQENFSAIVIPTWDDWHEGSMIEPTVEYGIKYLELTRHYISIYKNIPESDSNLMTPIWIYKIRKLTQDKSILEQMTEASKLIQNGEFKAADIIVQPIAEKLQVDQNKYFEPQQSPRRPSANTPLE